jgi:hypothetical protein
MAKKRDRHWTGNDRRRAGGGVEEERGDLRAHEGMSFAGTESRLSDGEIEAWEEDQITAPDLFADASDEDQMQASGGHAQQLGEEPRESETKDLLSRVRRR